MRWFSHPQPKDEPEDKTLPREERPFAEEARQIVKQKMVGWKIPHHLRGDGGEIMPYLVASGAGRERLSNSKLCSEYFSLEELEQIAHDELPFAYYDSQGKLTWTPQ